MAEKFVAIYDKEIVWPASVTPNGYNDFPEPFREISVDEYIHVTGSQIGYFRVFRQILDLDIFKCVKNCDITIYGSFAIAIVYPNDWKCNNIKGEYHIKYKDKLRYFYIGCKHHYKEVATSGNCMHRYKCFNCGHEYTVDSSG